MKIIQYYSESIYSMLLTNELEDIRESTKSMLEKKHCLLIDGKLVDSHGDNWLSVYDPSSGEVIAKAPAANAADVDYAVSAAKSALIDPGWGDMRPHERERLMHKLADLVMERADDIAEICALEGGRRLADAKMIDAEYSAYVLRYMAGWPTKICGDTLPISTAYMPVGIEHDCSTYREPVGVVAAITPWNVPLAIAVWKIAPAIAAGCTVVLKPAEQTPLSCLLFGELVIEAGFPPGVINIVTGTGSEAGEHLINHPDISKISFTGSTQVGERIAEIAGRSLKSVSLELGGKSPVVIMPDADLDLAIPAAAGAIFANQGQNCCAGSRLYVHKSIYEKVIQEIVKIAEGLQVGASLSPGVDLCPLISRAQQQKVEGIVEAAVAEGAFLECGGASLDQPGFYFQPTVLSDVNNDMDVVREEVFGPVLVAQSFESFSEAVVLANDNDFGLGASIFTENLNTAHAFAESIQAGSVWINIHNILDVGVPFGGFKRSGLGNDLGKESVLSHTKLKAVYINRRKVFQ